MKKKILLALVFVAGLSSCTEDYTDWLSPQSNTQNEAAEVYTFSVEPVVNELIDFASETRETITLFTTSTLADSYTITLSGEGTDTTAEVIANSDGEVSLADLQAAVATVYGGGSEERTLTAVVSALVDIETLDGHITARKHSEPFTFKAKLSGGFIFDTDPVLYLTGDHYGWGASEENWVPLVPVNGHETISWIIIYLHEGEQFKFAPQPAWIDDFGANFADIYDYAGMNPSGDNNIVTGKAGWYLLKVDNTAGARTVEIFEPKIYLIGDACSAGWSISDDCLFSIPDTENGQFVSPEFVADKQVRMCVTVLDNPGANWWRSEFIVNSNGQIQFRGAGGDQERFTVKAGQRCYLNFSNGSGVYK